MRTGRASVPPPQQAGLGETTRRNQGLAVAEARHAPGHRHPGDVAQRMGQPAGQARRPMLLPLRGDWTGNVLRTEKGEASC